MDVQTTKKKRKLCKGCTVKLNFVIEFEFRVS